MEDIIYCIFSFLLFFGYFSSVFHHASENYTDEWWDPFLMGAIYPLFWIYENRLQILGTFFFFVLFGAVPILLIKFFDWIRNVV